MSIGNLPLGQAKVITASGNVKVGAGGLLGILCSTTSAGTLILYDDAATGTSVPLTGTLTPAAGSWTPFPVGFGNGLNVVVSGTISATLVLGA